MVWYTRQQMTKDSYSAEEVTDSCVDCNSFALLLVGNTFWGYERWRGILMVLNHNEINWEIYELVTEIVWSCIWSLLRDQFLVGFTRSDAVSKETGPVHCLTERWRPYPQYGSKINGLCTFEERTRTEVHGRAKIIISFLLFRKFAWWKALPICKTVKSSHLEVLSAQSKQLISVLHFHQSGTEEFFNVRRYILVRNTFLSCVPQRALFATLCAAFSPIFRYSLLAGISKEYSTYHLIRKDFHSLKHVKKVFATAYIYLFNVQNTKKRYNGRLYSILIGLSSILV